VKASSRRWSAYDITLVGMFTALMAIGANITSFAPFLVVGGVPITLQTFFSVLAGALLGSRLGAISMLVYALVGLAGVPVFAKFSGGFGTIVSPTFGFILSFILVAYVTGKIIEWKQSPSKQIFIFATLVGMVINYVVGTNWMYYAYKLWYEAPEGFTYAMAWGWMMFPLPKDIILSILAGAIAPRIYKTMQKSSVRNSNHGTKKAV
jgi:biotin transport system substrate-specific component